MLGGQKIAANGIHLTLLAFIFAASAVIKSSQIALIEDLKLQYDAD